MGLSDRLSNTDAGSLAMLTGVKIVALLIFAGLLYYWRPVVHPFAYLARYSAVGMIVIGSTTAVALLLYLAPPLRDETSGDPSPVTKAQLLGAWFIIVLVIGVVVGMAGGVYQGAVHAEQTMDRADEVETLPAMDVDHPRITPRKVADKQTRGSVSYRKYQLGASDIMRGDNGSLVWSYATEPEGPRNSIVEEQDGVVTADLTTMDDREIRTVRVDMKYGMGMTIGSTNDSFLENRDVRWKLLKSDYWTTYQDDVRPFIHDGQPYLYFPKTTYNVNWLPVPHRTVEWDGGALVHADGTIEQLSSEAARNHPVLEGQPLFPYANTKERLGDIGYREGIVNAWIEHENQVERADMPAGAGNEQPFVVDLEERPISYVTALEPYGDDTRALDEVWFTNSRTGKFTVYSSGEKNLIGPERAVAIARSTDTNTNWGENFRIVEPVPVVIDGELWWHMKVVPSDSTAVSRNIFVHGNADDGRTAVLYSTDAVTDLLGGTNVTDVNETQSSTGGTTGSAPTDGVDTEYVLVVRNEDGEVVDTVPVGSNETISINGTAPTGNTTVVG